MSAVLGSPLLVGFAALLGLAIGSFLNVVIYRVPAGMSVVRPPSACPHCEHAIRERDNIPVVSWVLLRGRCRDCSAPIPVRYPAVEAVTAAVFAAVTATVTVSVWVLAACLVLAAAGIALTLIDLDCGRLPFPITAVAAVFSGGFLTLGWGVSMLSGVPVSGQVVAVAVGAVVWAVVYAGLWFGSAGRAMGLGDVALAPVLGGVLGAPGLSVSLVGLASGFVIGAVAGVAVLAIKGRGEGGTTMPFGPSMIAGAAVAVFAGEPIADAYLHLLGLA